MYKLGQVVRFSPDRDHHEARRHWTAGHADLGLAVPGLLRYVQNYAAAALSLVAVEPDRRPAFDGYGCAWFADRESFRVATESPEWGAMVADGVSLFDSDLWPSMSAAVEERLIIDGPVGPLKTMWFGRFKDDVRADPALTREASQQWTRSHGLDLGVKVPGIGRYLQNHVIEPLGDGVDPGFDGFSEMWFEDERAFELTMSSDEWSEMNEDAAELFDRDWIVGGWSAALDEHVVRS